MGYKASGRLHAIHEAKQITERFRKREFVVEITDGRFPQYVIFQLTGDRCESIDGFQVGDEVDVDFSVRGREWRSPSGDIRYFNSLDVWTVERPRMDSAGFDAMDVGDGAPPPSDGDFGEDIPF